MKKQKNNFIAFTLSEMMIVLLIISVISAATLPAITQKNQVKPMSSESPWKYDNQYTKGFYTGVSGDSADNFNVAIGTKYFTNTDISNCVSNYCGRIPLKLFRPSPVNMNLVRQNRSDIAFFNRDGDYQGKIAADANGNIAVGRDAGYTTAQINNANYNLYIGTNAGKSTRATTQQEYNTIIGYNAASSGSYANLNNIIIAPHSGGTHQIENNVTIGQGATRNSLYLDDLQKGYRNTVSIGYYAAENAVYSTNTVNIGIYAGARPWNQRNISSDANAPDRFLGDGFNNFVNIGPYAGFYSGVNLRNYSNINIGQYAGAMRLYNQYGDTINLGSYAGYYSTLKSRNILNIGNYAGAYATKSSLNIGAYAGYGYSSSYDDQCNNTDTNIGYYAGALAGKDDGYDNANSLNIGHYAGLKSENMGSAINVGYYAGYAVKGDAPVNIGYYAGSNSGYINTSDSDTYNHNVFIGNYAGQGTKSRYNVVIGCEGLSITASYDTASKMCIGGKYPTNNAINSNYWNPSGQTQNNGASTLITTPGAPAASSVGWDHTAIYLVANHVVSLKSTMSKFSDKTLKENIKKTQYGIDKLRKVAIYQYNMKGSKTPHIGVIAQELMEIYPHAVSELPEKIKGETYYTVLPDWIIFSLAQSIKDVDNMIVSTHKELSASMKSITKLALKVSSIENRLNNLSQSNKDLQAKLAEIDNIVNKMERK